ncbi:Cyclic di-GMP phosphodiesterase CdgJ [Vibrio stylophorae]|uniref:Cyclic di-GMP phosphodiesterase CdgJ n=1 Tax=Vibrio stylophorae TaxID=659351 RepID=A0ABM8ZUB8_9VIBR|nr:HDOD domain-containing protein [Vibrio stylophorae]CAH0533905.1 Cyclic di-GMP phosphodiesterase CdgJ [Vibrio stylophorae]
MYSYVARQPILTRKKETFGYELLFRNGPENAFPRLSAEQATNKLLLENYWSDDIDKITDGKPSFINFPQDSLLRGLPTLLPRDKVIIEVLETATPNDSLYNALRILAGKGYILALDDFIPSEEWLRFLPLVRLIKFDISVLSIEKVRNFVRQHRSPKLRFLAERVETHEQFEAAKAAGFDLFQGYFFSRPQMLQRKEINSSKITILQIFAEVCQTEIDYNKVERLLATDVSMSYKLLRFVNNQRSLAAKPIESFKQALVFLGEMQLRRFVSIVATAQASDDKPSSLYQLSLQRAKMCESLADKIGLRAQANRAFLVGLFSLLDSLLDTPIDVIIEKLPLSEDIILALTEHEGPLGELLYYVQNYDQANWAELEQQGILLDISDEVIAASYVEAVEWAQSFKIE